jgi:hypothetical protein
MIDCIRNREAEDLKAGLECHVHFYIYFPLHLLPTDFGISMSTCIQLKKQIRLPFQIFGLLSAPFQFSSSLFI